ncbi:hypothetical protein CC78DRAFT_583243 [Lojkania enalia]|uniref:Uncharacterized protein n=1 Tax=Lojkania enalia TaxID=147567 RepID=A0A9P4K3F3_9PLEO|nr:hypothetical protein CC78DRAFT_583243 [Didymosphaeria enalia]
MMIEDNDDDDDYAFSDGDTLRRTLIFPLFFKADSNETANNLNNRQFKKLKHSEDESWCQPGNNFLRYKVAGHTILHEMAHLHSVGSASGLDERQVYKKNGDP